MSALAGFGSDVPWWGWMFLFIGIIAFFSVFGALFLPDWPDPDYTVDFQADPGSEEFLEWSSLYLNIPVLRGGTATLLQNGDALFPSMLQAIREARDSINFEMYIFEPDEIGQQFMDALKERAQAGVEVRLLLDAFGCWKLRKRSRNELMAAGVKLSLFRPLGLRNLVRFYRRTHRRAIVIDGVIGFTGGAAISQKWKGDVGNEHEWRDSMTRVTGPLAAGIQSAFAGNWVYCTGEVIAGPRFFPRLTDQSGPCGVSVISSPSDSMQPIRLMFWISFFNAQKRLWICSSYFIPDIRLRHAVIARARAGVDVRILVPGNQTDAVPVQATGRGYYDELLSAGVRIFEYEPAMMHAKSVVVDGRWSVVGSANLDERSMELNEENILCIADADFARAIEDGVEEDIKRSKEVHLDEWRNRSVFKKAFERVCKALIEQY